MKLKNTFINCTNISYPELNKLLYLREQCPHNKPHKLTPIASLVGGGVSQKPSSSLIILWKDSQNSLKSFILMVTVYYKERIEIKIQPRDA